MLCSLPVKAWIPLATQVTFGSRPSIQHPERSSTALAKVSTSYMLARLATIHSSISNNLQVARNNTLRVGLARIIWHLPRLVPQALMCLEEVHSVSTTTILLEHNSHTKARRRGEEVSLIYSGDSWFVGEIKGILCTCLWGPATLVF